MLEGLEAAVHQALSDGYQGFWVTGDMTWEFGSKKKFGKLLEYEWKLEDLFRRQPCLSGICQYHVLRSHQKIFINETLSRLNPHYVTRDPYSDNAPSPDLEDLKHLCVLEED